jgi:hypothetical protein
MVKASIVQAVLNPGSVLQAWCTHEYKYTLIYQRLQLWRKISYISDGSFVPGMLVKISRWDIESLLENSSHFRETY